LDLLLVKSQFLLLDSAAECLISEANVDKTYGGFKEMGSGPAGEPVAFLESKWISLRGMEV
jgi:hypothetical protein